MLEQMRLRFAPSPTGPFHIGGARSALFNWLWARKNNGVFILRIEDTDRERSTRASEENIKASLRWLGMDWDEGVDAGGEFGPYRQSERLELYRQYAGQLLATDKAYHCFCSAEELEEERQRQLASGLTPRYTGKCRQLTAEQRAAFITAGYKPVVRFRTIPDQEVVFDDIVRGRVAFHSNGIGDFVIVKADGMPVYNYAVVIDDALMKITHVIRAEEHLSNTPRQIILFTALGFRLPQFGHVSLILGKDRTKMSKRHGATSVEQYRELGYLPAALVNFLALLGWSPVGEREIFSIKDLINEFSLDRVAKNPAIFDIDKLNWLNGQYVRQLTAEQVVELAWPSLCSAGLVQDGMTPAERVQLIAATAVVQEHVAFGAQLPELLAVFYDCIEPDEAALEVLKQPDISLVADMVCEKLSINNLLEGPAVKEMLKSVALETGLPNKKVFMPVRVLVTGSTKGPDLDKLIPVLGAKRTIERIQRMRQYITR